MNYSRLKERQVAVKATPLPNRATTYNMTRRDLPKNNIDSVDPIDQSYQNFFEFEQDLANLKPSSELYFEANEKEINNNILESNNNDDVYNEGVKSDTRNTSGMILEDLDIYAEKNFEFVQCEFIKHDGDRCKRQAPKNHKVCSKHKKI
jgi:hypothetical protein